MRTSKRHQLTITSLSTNDSTRHNFRYHDNKSSSSSKFERNKHHDVEELANGAERGSSWAKPASHENSNDLLWLENNIELTRFLINTKQNSQAHKKLQQLYAACELLDGTDDPNKSAYSLQLYALELLLLVTLNSKD